MRPYCTYRCHYPPGHRTGPQAVRATEHLAWLARTRPREIVGMLLFLSVFFLLLPIGLGELGVGTNVNIAISVATLIIGLALCSWPIDPESMRARYPLDAQHLRPSRGSSEPSGLGVAYAAYESSDGGAGGG